jgi:hypothetical protein
VRWAAVLLLACAAHGGEIHEGWFLVNNSGQAKLTQKNRIAEFGRATGGGMDVLRANLKQAPAPGQEFLLKAKFKADRVGNGWFKIFFYDKNGTDLGQGQDVKSLRGSYDWQEIVLDQKAPEGTASATIMVLLVQPGTLWVKDIRFEPKGEVARKPVDNKLAKWLDRNAVEVRTLSIDGDLRDLDRFARQLRGVRVVQLGENTHGDGAAFAAKCRLIRWLHEKMGFDVVAFESGMYECDRATRMLKPGADPVAVMRASIFPIWHTKQTKPLFEYLVAQSGTRKPMALTGFDIRTSGEGAKNLVPDALSALKAVGVSPATVPSVETLAALFRKHREALVEEHGARETAFLDRCLELRVIRNRFEGMLPEGEDRLLGGDRAPGAPAQEDHAGRQADVRGRDDGRRARQERARQQALHHRVHRARRGGGTVDARAVPGAAARPGLGRGAAVPLRQAVPAGAAQVRAVQVADAHGADDLSARPEGELVQGRRRGLLHRRHGARRRASLGAARAEAVQRQLVAFEDEAVRQVLAELVRRPHAAFDVVDLAAFPATEVVVVRLHRLVARPPVSDDHLLHLACLFHLAQRAVDGRLAERRARPLRRREQLFGQQRTGGGLQGLTDRFALLGGAQHGHRIRGAIRSRSAQ